jgi:hypothetical protein
MPHKKILRICASLLSRIKIIRQFSYEVMGPLAGPMEIRCLYTTGWFVRQVHFALTVQLTLNITNRASSACSGKVWESLGECGERRALGFEGALPTKL